MRTLRRADLQQRSEANHSVNGWVHTVFYSTLGSDKSFLKAKVNRSQAVTDKPHEAWVCVERDCTILNAHCTCMAGLEEVCSHVAAILFKVEASVRLGYNKVACTSMPCTWNQNFTKKVEAVPLYEISFEKSKKTNFHLPSSPAPQHAGIAFENTASFLQKLRETNPTAVIFTVTEPRPNPPTPKPSLPVVLTSLYNPEYTKLSDTELATKCDDILQNITINQEESINVEELTRNQSLSTKWYKYREGRLTASNFYDICHTNVQRPSVSLIKRIMQYFPNIDTPAIKWGKSNEETALKEYTELMLQHNEAFSTRQSGLVLNPDYPTLGASPDAVTDCPCCGKGLVEIKCPFKYKNTHPCSVKDPGFYLKPHAPRATGKQCNNQLAITSKHFYQVQGQMALCNVDFCDFVCWTTSGIHVERIKRDEHFFSENVLPLLKDFFLFAVLPELLTRKIREVNNNVPQDNTVCICGKPETFDDMIACDSGHCKVEWYHFKCVGLKSTPQGLWSCLPCRKMPPTKKNRQ
ncbi:uncharacterized protein LOC133198543 [Saccostrea echinata]|uniref:uncharacterized protein LOC133198543 n=1 Tax=Saccostrea echinata TaxID=191078 RepID=UPI002A824457|nr:uncharacterized protein LOC133198543 [Saccostrea echinata]